MFSFVECGKVTVLIIVVVNASLAFAWRVEVRNLDATHLSSLGLT